LAPVLGSANSMAGLSEEVVAQTDQN
jgi:hypothetical protein